MNGEMVAEVAFDTIKAILSVIVFGIVAWKLITRSDKFTWIERAGMGFTAAGCMMMIGPVTHKPSPFDDWAFTLMLFGNALYFIGRMTRHWLNNYAAERDAIQRLRDRGIF